MPENWRKGRSRSRRARGRAVAVRMPLARRTDLGDSNYAGLEVDVCHDLQRCLREVAEGRALREVCRGEAQSLKDREILEFLGDNSG